MSDSLVSNSALAERGSRVFVPNYRQQQVALAGGEGARVVDVEGRQYIDLASGIAVSSLGYGHQKLIQAVQAQAGQLFHASNIVWNEPAVRAAELLVQHSFGDRVFFANSGAEANEAMFKLARKVFHDRGEGRFEIITTERSFHGRTLGMITCTGQEKYRVGFEPLIPGVRTVPFDDLEAMEAAITERTAAIMIEPIQGEGGVRVPSPGYIRGLRDLCDEKGCLLLVDEVQSGVGRTGKMWGYEHEGIYPDAMSVAKGVGGGMPLGAMITTDELAAHLTPGSHGSTYGGNPVACAAAGVVLEETSQPAFLERVTELGNHLLDRIVELQRKHERIAVQARGRGLWAGLELNLDASALPK
jgi:predicted acetylornithine/succinylornithine family transaminase